MPITLTLSPFQLTCCIAVTFAAVALSYVLGVGEGRRREACEPTQQIDEDDGETFGRRHDV